MIPLKSKEDLEMLRQSGKILSRVMRILRDFVKAGISTEKLNQLAEESLLKQDALPAFKGYQGYPASICTSINEEIIHGIPGARILQEGDILSLDLGVNYRGYFSDAAITLGIGRISPRFKKLIDVTKQSLAEGIKKALQGNHLSDISYAIQSYVERHGFSVVRQFVGHGIGNKLHEEPEIPNFGRIGRGPVLKSGMVFAIEPMVNMGSWETKILDNGWTAVTTDGSLSAHFEHTVAITEQGPEILTA